jgi:type IV pilus assembly protein PilY1
VAFRATDGGAGSLTSGQLGTLDSPYRAVDDSADYLNYLRGDRSHEQASSVAGSSKAYRTRAKLLGDIVGSRARPVGPPSLPLSDATNPGYSTFKTTWKDRPTVVYVGANDGMMHAFNGTLSGANAGKEIFAYVPSAVFSGPDGTPTVSGLASLGNPALSHRFLVNATPTVFDIDLGKTWNGSAVDTDTDWRSVLIGGLGKGGRSYYAIDVTDPASIASEAIAAGKVLWEFSPPAGVMGFTFGEPVVAKTRKWGWTVIFPSGYNNVDGKGYLFFVNPKTGALLETVSTGEGTVANDAGLAHANAYVLDFSDGYADAVYAGDLLGNLWRFDVTPTSGSYAAPLKLARFNHEVDGLQPVTSRPVIELHPKTKKRVVMVGTGRLLADTDIASTKEQSFYAIIDGNAAAFNATAPSGVAFPIERDELVADTNLLAGVTPTIAKPMGWYVDLGKNPGNNVAWRIVSDPTTFFGTTAFAPTLPNADACSPSGTSRIYAVDFASGISKLLEAGVVTSYISGGTGVITDLRFLSVDGKVRLIGGSDRGEVKRLPGNFGSTVGLKRLNWRELPAAN